MVVVGSGVQFFIHLFTSQLPNQTFQEQRNVPQLCATCSHTFNQAEMNIIVADKNGAQYQFFFGSLSTRGAIVLKNLLSRVLCHKKMRREFTKGVDKEKWLLAGCEIDDETNLQAAFQHFLHVGDDVGCHPCREQVSSYLCGGGQGGGQCIARRKCLSVDYAK